MSGLSLLLPPRRASLLAAVLLVASLVIPARRNAPTLPIEERANGAGWVWLGEKLRGEIVSAEAARVPASAVLLIAGERSYFIDRGGGRYEVRALSRAPRAGERVVVEGAFLLKSELFR